ncbi:MAG: hypothetical protein LBG69_09195 [Zoogloeaceae bacterium]|jgi:hypothetical protein|nr:hypothetical protein [Zoogloeaceae bacterium]
MTIGSGEFWLYLAGIICGYQAVMRLLNVFELWITKKWDVSARREDSGKAANDAR